jgi:hypothetical protein
MTAFSGTLRQIAVLLCLGCALWSGQGQGQGKGKGKPKNEKVEGAAVQAGLRFGIDDARMIQDYYRPRLRDLPPGLEKKVARGGVLPPGWQKKVQAFPVDLDGRLAGLPAGYRRVISAPVAMLIHDATNTVLDILELVR